MKIVYSKGGRQSSDGKNFLNLFANRYLQNTEVVKLSVREQKDEKQAEKCKCINGSCLLSLKPSKKNPNVSGNHIYKEHDNETVEKEKYLNTKKVKNH